MINTDNLNSCIDLANGASADLHRTMLHTMQQMADRIAQLEARLDGLDGDRHDSDFQSRVLEVLEVRSGSCRVALGLDDQDVERWMLSVIEENSYTVFTHIEAELEEKLDALTQSYGFAEAVKEAVEGSIVQTVEELIEERISADLLGADAEDVVRKGLRHLI
jgi:hypothetical protein